MSIDSKQRIIFLDYLRVFAFVSVLVGHKFYQEMSSFVMSVPTPHITEQYFINLFLSMFTGGGAGVVVFFMISGYIILHVLQKEKPVEFMIKRVFRIYPLLIVAIITQVLLQDAPIDYMQTLQQISLMGDFFQAPHALAGVEWTLRVEIIFYILMFILSFSFLLRDKGYLLLSVFSLLSIFLFCFAPFPNAGWSKAYLSMYFPFLLIGSTIYLYEHNRVNIYALIGFVLLVFTLCFKLTAQYQQNWQQTNFILVGFLVFVFFWSLRNKKFILHPYIDKHVITLSLLTYSVYLFHNFLWTYIGQITNTMGLESKYWIVFFLLFWCFVMFKLIEMPMNKVGKKIAIYYTTKGKDEINHNPSL